MKEYTMDNQDRFGRFMSQFKFDSSSGLLVGIEREMFLTDISGNIVPRAQEVLACLGESVGDRFGFELSACQLEERIGPCIWQHLEDAIYHNERIISLTEETLGIKRRFIEVAPANMPLDIYPHPEGRYQRLAATMPERVLSAACRVAGIHVHVGMPDHITALRVYNRVIKNCDKLCEMGDGSFGERLRLYSEVAPDYQPIAYRDWQDFYGYMLERGLDQEPRSLWTLIRLSVHGTIEFRTFGTTDNPHRLIYLASQCHKMCKQAMG